MSWRTGSKLFIEMWPLIQGNIVDRTHRIDFTARLLQLLVDDDMDPYDVEDVHADVRAALRKIGVELAQSELFPDEGEDDV
ncbi:MAG TPA: hypothetical protein VF765_13925 [Polyangiaceae bacterium]